MGDPYMLPSLIYVIRVFSRLVVQLLTYFYRWLNFFSRFVVHCYLIFFIKLTPSYINKMLTFYTRLWHLTAIRLVKYFIICSIRESYKYYHPKQNSQNRECSENSSRSTKNSGKN
ncbi:uncharacterized protein LOC132029685 [Lycium ferocissimum]|uniref:uncharacterized protein LOC132029685 n=1 Tax=Lycium ferocissimum TaxID=112874 RepID=UPI0028156B21|nr:uncharacterized protein LOC132029685 [Lycium ferocissimum]